MWGRCFGVQIQLLQNRTEEPGLTEASVEKGSLADQEPSEPPVWRGCQSAGAQPRVQSRASRLRVQGFLQGPSGLAAGPTLVLDASCGWY